MMSDKMSIQAEDPKTSNAEATTCPLTPSSNIEFRKRQVLPTVNTANLVDSLSLLVLLDHAKLYAVVDYILLPDLQALTFERLRHNLNSMELERLSSTPKVAATSSLVTLVQHVYGNMARPQNRGRADAEACVFVFSP